MAGTSSASRAVATVAHIPVAIVHAPARAVRGVREAFTDPPEGEVDLFEEMTLAEHLDELRSRIVKICMSLGLAFIIGVILASPMLSLIKRTAQIQAFNQIDVTDGITSFFKVALYIAIAISFPIIFYQFFAFVAPGMTRKEKRIVYGSLPFVVLLFLAGASFAFFFAIPRAFKFLSSFQSQNFDFAPTFGSVAAFFIQVSLGMGLAFETPIVMYLLARLKIVSPERMGASRRYAAVAVLIAAALITPTPDPINMVIVAVPIYLIFELGLIFARIGARRARNDQPPGEAAAA